MLTDIIKKLAFLVILILAVSPGPIDAGDYINNLLDENSGLYQKILYMPFNQELLKGTLNEDIFKNYIIQDYIYLQNYRKTFAILLSKAPDQEASAFIVYQIKSIDEEIKAVHEIYLEKFSISKDELLKTAPYPSTEFYDSYLIKTAYIEPFEVGLAATLPCNWVYYRIGADMNKTKLSPDNKYRQWIEGYAPDPWETSDTKAFVDLIEKYMKNATLENRQKMTQAFKTAMKLEYMFWDGIYRNLNWIE
jgi:thiaminase (transcriptional activator TenA)